MINQDDDSVLYLWDKRTLYIGDLLGLVTLTPASASLLVGLTGDFQFWTPSHGKVRTSVALVPAGATLSLDHGDQRMLCSHLDPMSNDVQLLQGHLTRQAGEILYDSPALPAIRDCCQRIYQNRPAPEVAHQSYLQAIFPETPIETSGAKHFAAIKKTIAIIKNYPADNPSNETLAAQVGLSPSQLQRQFKAVMGVPVRRYRLWYRLFVTAAFMGYGMSLTNACLEAGFSDASHFNHTFRSMLGVKPSYVLKRRDQIRIMLGNSCRQKLARRLPGIDSVTNARA